MFFLVLATLISTTSFLLHRMRRGAGWRAPLRHGIGGAFLFTGCDHFVSLEQRYLPMIPPYLDEWAMALVLISGMLEITGALGLLLPARLWARLGLPPMRATA